MNNRSEQARRGVSAFGSLLLCTLLLAAPSTWAQWELDGSASVTNFISIKNGSVGEVHSFTSMIGFIGAGGAVQLAIDLDSVDTLIDIRNERMRELLFKTAKFPAAKITAQVDPAVLAAAKEGGVTTMELPVTLSLHGMQKKLVAPIAVVGEDEERIRVYSTRPVLVSAADFGLEAGIEALREIAGLKAISTSVPVTLSLLFRPR